MVKLGLSRKTDKAYELHYKLAPATGLVFEEGNPAGIKAVLNKLKIAEKEARLPLISASSRLTEKISKFVDGF